MLLAMLNTLLEHVYDLKYLNKTQNWCIFSSFHCITIEIIFS